MWFGSAEASGMKTAVPGACQGGRLLFQGHVRECGETMSTSEYILRKGRYIS
jgi:hypothetical protein